MHVLISLCNRCILNNVTQVKVGGYPLAIAVNPDTNKIYVANAFSNTTSVIDGDTNIELAKVKVGTYPFAIAVNPNINQIYVANAGSNTVSVIDGNTNNVTQVKVGFDPRI